MNRVLDKDFWNNRYLDGSTGWDLGKVSEPLAAYADQVVDKNTRILIPGCGNAYEAAYLADLGFTNITLLDIAPALVEANQKRFQNVAAVKVVEGDFFQHEGNYDLVVEQTFFCAIDPALRPKYVEKIAELLKAGGKIAGVLFDTTFPTEGPPFGGNTSEYRILFEPFFKIHTLSPCYNSAKPRAGSEAFIIAEKK